MSSTSTNKVLLCYFGHHKCASAWLIGILYDICFALGLKPFEKQIVLIDNPSQVLSNPAIDFFLCQTSDYTKVKTLPSIRGFHVIRDPRDLIVSGYYSHLKTHAINGWMELQQHRNNLQKHDVAEGLFLEMEFSNNFIDHIAEWNYNDSNIYEVKYEDIVQEPAIFLKSILNHLNLFKDERSSHNLWLTGKINRIFNKLGLEYRLKNKNINSAFIKYLVRKHSFERLADGRIKGEENSNSHFRKGLAGDWKNHFNEQHKKRFKEIYGDLVVKLGYERDNSW
jgi:hypothetical protein